MRNVIRRVALVVGISVFLCSEAIAFPSALNVHVTGTGKLIQLTANGQKGDPAWPPTGAGYGGGINVLYQIGRIAHNNDAAVCFVATEQVLAAISKTKCVRANAATQADGYGGKWRLKVLLRGDESLTSDFVIDNVNAVDEVDPNNVTALEDRATLSVERFSKSHSCYYSHGIKICP